MAAIALFSVAHENDQCQQIRSPRKSIYTRFKGTIVNSEKKLSSQLVAILIIGGKLKI